MFCFPMRHNCWLHRCHPLLNGCIYLLPHLLRGNHRRFRLSEHHLHCRHTVYHCLILRKSYHCHYCRALYHRPLLRRLSRLRNNCKLLHSLLWFRPYHFHGGLMLSAPALPFHMSRHQTQHSQDRICHIHSLSCMHLLLLWLHFRLHHGLSCSNRCG